MGVTAWPTLTVAGQPVALGGPAGLVAVDKLSMPWGRSSVLEQVTPSTLDVTVLDRSAGAEFARRDDLVGQPIVAGWQTSTGAGGVNFRGRITEAAASPRRAGGFRVALSCSSKEVEAANHRAPDGTLWPAESFAVRLQRIGNLIPGLFANSIAPPSRLDVGLVDVADPSLDLLDYPAAPLDAGGRDALDLLRQLWGSLSPVPMIYSAAADAIIYAGFRRQVYSPLAGRALVGQLVASPAHGGRIVARPVAGGGLALDSARLGYDGPLTQPLDARITRVEVRYFTGPMGEVSTTAAAGTGDPAGEAAIGRRTLTIDSMHSSAGYAAQLAGMWARLVYAEGRQPRLAPLRYRVGPDEFHDDAAAQVFLLGRETTTQLFLGRSWITRLGRRPVVGLIGGSITYAGGEWDLQLQTAPIDVETTGYSSVTASQAAATNSVRLVDLDPSLSAGDLAHVQIGAGYTLTTQPPWGTP